MTMISQLLTDPLTWIMLVFTTLCAWSSWRTGHKEGLLNGVDATLAMLTDQDIIELEHGNDGEIIINSKGGKKFKTNVQ